MTQKGLLILVVVCFALDDLDNVRIEGTVRDELGRPIPSASIEVRSIATGLARYAVTSDEGFYRISALPPFEYELKVEAEGFRTATINKLKGTSGSTLRCNMVLQLAPVVAGISISASAESPRLDTSRTFNGSTISSNEIKRLPLESRNPFELLFILAGTAPPAYDTRLLADGDLSDNFLEPPEEAGTVSLQGGTPYSNNFTIDGLDNNDDRAARERFIPSMDSVEEVQVITNQFAAEYGRASGGRINIRLRGGTNDHRGSASWFARNEKLNSNSFFRNADPLRGFRLPLNEQVASIAIGGPISMDRLFYFAAFEHEFSGDTASISALVPVLTNPKFALPLPNGTNLGHLKTNSQGIMTVNGGADTGLYDLDLSTPRRSNAIQSRLDFHHSSGHSLFTNLTAVSQRDERSFPGGRRTPETIRSRDRSSNSIALGDSFAGRAVTNEARFQFSNLIPHDGPVSSRPVVIIEIQDPRDSGERTGRLLAGSSNLGASSRRENRLQIQDIATFLFGKHSVRSGADVHHIHSVFENLEDTTGTYYFSTIADFLSGTPERFRQRFNTKSILDNIYTGGFIQTDYRLAPSLNISAGIRWERESIVKDNNNAGLRTSLVWSPGTDGLTVVRTGFGVFFNRALLRTLDDFKLATHSLLIDTTLPAHSDLLPHLNFPSVLEVNDGFVKSNAVKETGFIRRIDQELRIPESYQTSLGVERQLRRGMKAELTCVFNRGAHLWRESNANAPRVSLVKARTLADYLTSGDFDNRRDTVTGQRPITSTGNADVVRFDRSETISRVVQEAGQRIVVFGLANSSTSNSTSAIKAALAAVRDLRPDPALEQVEELHSNGSSFYHGVSFEITADLGKRGNLRASYTHSKLIDDGVVNTSSPLIQGNLRNERELSLLDSRHRFAVSGYLMISGAGLSFTLLANSPRPFNIGINGNDRNLDDVNNDRPNTSGGLQKLSLPIIGTNGNLPRNAGRGPWQHTLNVRLFRQFVVSERVRFTPLIEAFNPLNITVFSYGAEYVDWNDLSPRRTIKPRTLRVGVKFEF